MATIGNAPVFPTESVLPGNLQVTGNATISGSSATVNGDEVRTVGTSGAILQVVQGTTTTSTLIQTTTYTDTTLSASITPSSSSNKILIIVNQGADSYRPLTVAGAGIRLLRDSTVVHTPGANATGPIDQYVHAAGASAVEIIHRYTICFLDSPATTSSVTYKTQGRPHTTANTGRVTFQPLSGTSTITLMEVVA